MAKTQITLKIPTAAFNSLQKLVIAGDATSVSDLLRQAAKLFLYVRSIVNDPDARLLIEKDGQHQEVRIDQW